MLDRENARAEEPGSPEDRANRIQRLGSIIWRRLGLPLDLKNDLVSAGFIRAWNHVPEFDPGRGVSFDSFVAPYIRGAMLDLMADEMRHRELLPGGAVTSMSRAGTGQKIGEGCINASKQSIDYVQYLASTYDPKHARTYNPSVGQADWIRGKKDTIAPERKIDADTFHQMLEVALNEMMDKITPLKVLALRLFLIKGYTQKEISHILKTNMANVHHWLFGYTRKSIHQKGAFDLFKDILIDKGVDPVILDTTIKSMKRSPSKNKGNLAGTAD